MENDDFKRIIVESEVNPNCGSQILLREDLATIVQNSLLFFESQRYYLSSWCVMSNHVHVVVSPIGTNDVSQILHSWKSFTANRINEILHRSGPCWSIGSFVHLVRSYNYWMKFNNYTENNPVEAGYCLNKSEWYFSSACQKFERSQYLEFVSPYDLPKVEIQKGWKFPKLEKNGCTYFITFCLDDAAKLWKARNKQVSKENVFKE
jgi:REP element-mobilizing transposase RayT